KTWDGAGTGSFTSNITGLAENTTYYVRAYATNGIGTGYGNEVSFRAQDLGMFVPVLTTSAVTDITTTAARSGGNIISDGGYSVTARGVCWRRSPGPTLSDSVTTSGTGIGSFTSDITSLTASTTYYVRAYATSIAGTGYGNELSFSTQNDSSGGDTIMIGTQVWMLKNLDVDKYRNGDPIPQVTDPAQWYSKTTGAWCYYNNDSTMSPIYGRLYNWYAVNDPRGLAPSGWHIPTDDEWKTLEVHLGMTQAHADSTDWRGTDEGGKLKETGTSHWQSPNTGASNSSGFTALPGGYRSWFNNAPFSGMGSNGYWWSSTADGAATAWNRILNYGLQTVWRRTSIKTTGYSVRCVRD
ncbi:MAG: fibrobacter succinogenes major paralogous domain-containing protein, partial [Bacteroidetes bacterium]|nr:fibrobacter succinogenes major paralogous domain-containing protein [Bacteroidota bacterium]